MKEFYKKTDTVFITIICVIIFAIMTLYVLAAAEEKNFINPFYGLLPWFYLASIFVTFFNFIPAFIAYNNEHINKVSILIIDCVFGWTLLGWVICLVWAIHKKDSTENIHIDKYEQLEKLQNLKENGTITEAEFKIEKQRLLK